MRAGLLRYRVTLQSPTETPSEIAGREVEWDDEVTVWAAVDAVSGREYFSAREVNAEITHKVTLRYRAVEPSWRVKHGDRYLYVESIIRSGASLTLMCRESA